LLRAFVLKKSFLNVCKIYVMIKMSNGGIMIVEINKNDGPITRILKGKFNTVGGKVYVPMLRGKDKLFRATREGLYNDGFKGYLCKWEEFDEIINKLQELGGMMYRGDVAAQKGFKLGSDKLPLDTMDGYIALNFHHDKIGRSITRRSTYYACVLACANIVSNRRGKNGKGGYICFC
jgi:hypothetical protein